MLRLRLRIDRAARTKKGHAAQRHTGVAQANSSQLRVRVDSRSPSGSPGIMSLIASASRGRVTMAANQKRREISRSSAFSPVSAVADIGPNSSRRSGRCPVRCERSAGASGRSTRFAALPPGVAAAREPSRTAGMRPGALAGSPDASGMCRVLGRSGDRAQDPARAMPEHGRTWLDRLKQPQALFAAEDVSHPVEGQMGPPARVDTHSADRVGRRRGARVALCGKGGLDHGCSVIDSAATRSRDFGPFADHAPARLHRRSAGVVTLGKLLSFVPGTASRAVQGTHRWQRWRASPKLHNSVGRRIEHDENDTNR